MSAEFDHRFGPALMITLGALFCFFEGSEWMGLRPSFLIMHFSGVEGFFNRSYGRAACVAMYWTRKETPARSAIHTRLIIGFYYFACSFRGVKCEILLALWLSLYFVVAGTLPRLAHPATSRAPGLIDKGDFSTYDSNLHQDSFRTRRNLHSPRTTLQVLKVRTSTAPTDPQTPIPFRSVHLYMQRQ